MARRDGSGPVAGSTRYGGHGKRGGSEPVSYGACDAAVLNDAITAITDAGDAVLFGKTSDGGAYMVRFLSRGSSDVEYPATVGELQDVLVEATRIAQA